MTDRAGRIVGLEKTIADASLVSSISNVERAQKCQAWRK